MRAIFLSVCAVFAFGLAQAMEHDIRQMQERLAAQEARLAEQGARMAEQDARIADFNAKLASRDIEEDVGKASGLISLQKNAVVTIGGLVNTRFQYTDAKVDSRFAPDDDGNMILRDNYRRRATSKTSSLEITDAELHVQADINEHLEAFLLVNLHNAEDDFYAAEAYYLRWKDICNTGFGIKVGRDALVFGEEGFGELDSWAASPGNGLGDLDEGFLNYGGFIDLNGDLFGGGIPMHNAWDVSGVTQVTPYWEGFDGKLSVELSLFQNVYEDRPYAHNGPNTIYTRGNGVEKYRSRNYGFGSFTGRVGWTPIEDLKFTFSIGNYRSNGSPENEDYLDREYYTKNNTIYGIAASWRPSFFQRLNLWGQWIHGNNVYFFRDMKSDVVNFGASFDLAEGLTLFAQGDYLRTKWDFQGADQKGTGWAFYTGVQYSLSSGVSLEAGWRHEQVKWKDRGYQYAKYKADTIYAMCGLEF